MEPGTLDTERRPLVLVWELTQACDLACKHCRAKARPERHPDELSTAEGKQLLDDVRTFGDGQLVVLSGGDPMARPDLVDLVDYGVDNGLNMTVTPSGTASLTRQAIEALADAGVRRIALSLDGASAHAHDSFRGEEGSFTATVRAAQQIQDAGIPLQINTTVCRETLNEMPGIRDIVGELDAVLWSVFFLVPVGRGVMLSQLSPAQCERFMEWLAEVQRIDSVAIKTTEAPFFRRVRIAANQEEGSASHDGAPPGIANRGGIIAGDGFAFVSHLGEVFPSGFLPVSAGNVRDRSVVDVYRHADLFSDLRDRDNLHGKCGVCRYRAVCGGSRSRAHATTGDPLASDPLCAYIPDDYQVPERDHADHQGVS